MHPFKIAHRGFHQVHIENTLESFRAAYDSGCDMIEFDVQLSADGIPFIFHDDNANRLGHCDLQPFELPFSEIQKIILSNAQGETSKIPSLADFLNEFAGHPFYLELKIPAIKFAQENYWQSLVLKTIALVQASKVHPLTFLASFHLPLIEFCIQKDIFPNLAVILEDEESLQKAMMLDASANGMKLKYFSMAWNLFLKNQKQNNMLHTSVTPNRILLWDIIGKENFLQAEAEHVAGIVTDDMEMLLEL